VVGNKVPDSPMVWRGEARFLKEGRSRKCERNSCPFLCDLHSGCAKVMRGDGDRA
jgi:hypothetical protein